MQPSTSHIADLLWRRFQEELSAEEEATFREALANPSFYPGFAEEITSEQQLVEWWLAETRYQQEGVREKVLARIREAVKGTEVQPRAHRVHFLRRGWFKYAAAIIILFGIGAYLWNNYNKAPQSTTATITPSSHDILPGGQKATLTLADGRTIILDSAQNGQLATENGSEIIKRGGEIIYDASQYRNEAVVYNTMSTPKGGQYQLTLPDGTKVWLNAASKIIYPTRFAGKTREVKVEGEVYFEVKGNSKQPFIVKTNSDEITVLGTEFNINNYSDEPASKISLINGAVKVNEKLLKPGQAYSNGKIMQTDIAEDIAWKTGAFAFNKTDINVVLRQISRWYDVEIVYPKGKINTSISGSMGRDLTLNELMDVLNGIGVKGKIGGKKLIIYQ